MKQTLWKRILSLCLCLSLLVSLFPALMHSAQATVEVITGTEIDSDLMQTTEALKAEISKLPTTGALRNGRVRLSDFSQSANGSADIKDLRGKHFLVRGENGNHYIIDGSWTGTDGEVPMKSGTHVDGDAAYFTGGASPTRAFEFHYRGIASNGMPLYVLRFNNGRNLAVGSRYANWNNLYYVKGDTNSNLATAPQVRFDHPSGVNWIRISNASGSHGFRQSSDLSYMRWKDNSAGDNDYAGNALFLYRLWSTREIITAIHDMKGYLDTPEFFDEEVFGQFLTCLRESIDLFRKYNGWPTSFIDPYDFIQEKLEGKEAELRSFASRLSFEFQTPSAAELNKKTTIHQLPLACGYVIQTREGKIIIIDGGWRDNNTEGKYLFSYLQKITGDATPHIDAWFITHAHADHHGCVPTFADLYRDQVTIDAFYYHYPTYDQIKKYLSGCGVDDTWGAVDWIPTWLMPNFKNAEGGPTQGIICNTEHSGLCNNSFDFDEVHIDILLTFDDVAWAADNVSGRYSGTSANEGRVFSNKTFKELLNDNFNETSMVFRVTVGGKNVLFTGDINYIGGYMLDKFHTSYTQNNSTYYSIKSDYVQVSHHGHYGLPKKVYNKIDPDVAMWPCNYDEWNDYDYQNLICTKQWFNDMGAKNYVAYQGPQVFDFPLVRTEGAVTIPGELKGYVFDAKYYRDNYADLAKLYGNDENQLYYHFLNYGIEEGRSASPFFDVRFYANQNGAHLRDTLKGNYVAAFKDFLNKYKTSTLLKLSENFDAKIYAAAHKDLAGQGYTTNFALLKHYAENGYKTGEIASTTFRCDQPNTTWHDNCTVSPAVAPTCVSVGKTAGIKCATCGQVLKSQTSVATTGHSYSYKATKNPTTSATGTLTGTCSGCSATTTVTLPKLNTTDYTKTVTKAATCTATGTDIYKWNTTTYGSFSFSVTTEAKGHTVVIDEAVAPSCSATGLTEGKHCSVCNTVLVVQETVPATGHSYIYTGIDSQQHKISCENCDFVEAAFHTYTNGSCLCGEAEVKEPVENATLKLNHSLNLASDISVNLLVSKTLLAGFDMNTVYVESTVDTYEGNEKTGTTTIRIRPVESEYYYYFTLDGLTAVQMNDRISSVLYGTKDGQPYYSPTDEYSIATYAYSQMDNADRAQSLKTLCADLLRYGSMAQIFKGYRTDSPADADMTHIHKSYLSDIDGVAFGNCNGQIEDAYAPMVTWAGKALVLDSKVTVKFVINAELYVGDISNLSLLLSYRKADGTVGKVTLTNPVPYGNPGWYAFDFDGLMAAELRTVLNAAVYAGNTQISNTLCYSADTYGNGKTGTLLQLCKALFAYSDSAKAYFAG